MAGNGAYCFTANTLMIDGRKIADIKTHDQLKTVDANGNAFTATVNKVKQSLTRRLTELMVAGQLLVVTPNHPLQTSNGNWLAAEDIQQGTLLKGANGPTQVESVCTEAVQPTTVYSLELENNLPYFVGQAPVLAFGSCDLKTIYNLFTDVNKRISFKGLISRINNVGGNYSGFINGLASRRFTVQQIDKLSDAFKNLSDTDLKKIIDEFASGGDTYQTLFKSEKATEAWQALNIAAYNGKRKTASVLEQTLEVLSKEHITKSDLRTMISVNSELANRATELSAFLSDLDHFALYKNSNSNGFDKIISSLKIKWYGKADGANYVIAVLRRESATFPPAITNFEVSQSFAGDTCVYDAIVGTGELGTDIYFEFKSWGIVPPNKFAEQLMKDLNNPDIVDLSQLKWYFDADKIKIGATTDPALFEKNMKAAIDGLDLSLSKIPATTLQKFGVNGEAGFRILLDQNFSSIFNLK